MKSGDYSATKAWDSGLRGTLWVGPSWDLAEEEGLFYQLGDLVWEITTRNTEGNLEFTANSEYPLPFGARPCKESEVSPAEMEFIIRRLDKRGWQP